MKRFSAAILAGILLALGIASPASAHVWRADGNITVLLHINPIDAPVAGQPAELLFGIMDTTNHFATSTCECNVTVSENGKELLNKPPDPWTGGPSLFDYQMPFTFPDAAVYHIVVTGNPIASGTFQNFQVAYDERVNENPNNPSADSGLIFDLTMVGLAFLVAGTLYLCYKEVRKQWSEK